LQVRYRHTVLDASPTDQQLGTVRKDDGYDIQRAFLRYVAEPTKNIALKMLVDFAELKRGQPKQTFKLAYAELHATRWLQFDIGLLKRPYSLLELLPIAKHELADLGPTDDFIKNQGYGGRDIGAIARIHPLPSRRMATLSMGAFRGDLDEGFDASPLKLVGARLEVNPIKHLRFGVNGVYRPFKNVKMVKTEVEDPTTGVTETTYPKTVTMTKGGAMGVDATVAYKHLEVRGEFLLGQRTDPAVAANEKQKNFWAAWVVVAPKIKLGKWWLVPAVKAEILDVDAQDDTTGRRRVLEGVVAVVPHEGVRIMADVTRTWTDRRLTSMDNVPWTSGSHILYVTEPSWTRVTVQTQLMF
jgi:hypothetical protein